MHLFPQLKRDAVYLDAAATTPLYREVIYSFNELMCQLPGNPGRGLNKNGSSLQEDIEETRQLIANSYGIGKTPYRIIFTYGVTDAMNKLALLLKGKSRSVTSYNHHSSLLPWLDNIEYIKTNRYGRILDTNSINTEILIVPEIHNVTGEYCITSDIIEYCRKSEKTLIIDAAQSYSFGTYHIPEGIDAYLVSFHKGYGIPGSGFMILSDKLLMNKASVSGGGGIDEFTSDTLRYALPPHNWEVGTQPYHLIIANKQAHKYVMLKPGHGPKHINFRNELNRLGFNIISSSDSINITSFQHRILDATTIAAYLDHKNIIVRSGQHCVGLFAEDYGQSVRISTGPYNSEDDLFRLIEALKEMIYAIA